jgi:two-component system, OmpR family, response regulator RegX3
VSRVLVVDDEDAIRDAVSFALRSQGFDVDAVEDGEEAIDAIRHDEYEVLILDQMLPRLSGVEVCRRVRSTSDIPIIILTARDAEVDRVLGLEAGADDYVTKPFSMAELMSRVRAILRRRELDRQSRGSVIRVGALELDPNRHTVSLRGEALELTPSEFRLLSMLAEQPERVFSRREIMQHLWRSDFVGDERTADFHVANLRRKLGADALVTVRGVGYKLVEV